MCVVRSSRSNLPLLIILIERLFVFVRPEYSPAPPEGGSEAAVLEVIRYSEGLSHGTGGFLQHSFMYYFIYSSFIKTNKLDNVDGESGINFEAAD